MALAHSAYLGRSLLWAVGNEFERHVPLPTSHFTGGRQEALATGPREKPLTRHNCVHVEIHSYSSSHFIPSSIDHQSFIHCWQTNASSCIQPTYMYLPTPPPGGWAATLSLISWKLFGSLLWGSPPSPFQQSETSKPTATPGGTTHPFERTAKRYPYHSGLRSRVARKLPMRRAVAKNNCNQIIVQK